MNQTLARYLFFNETLYKNVEVQAETPVPRVVTESQQSAVGSQQSVVESRKPISESQQSKVESFKLKHKVLVLVDKFEDTHQELLGKMLKAVKLDFEQIDLVDIATTSPLEYQDFLSEKVTHQMISFGVGLGRLNWDLMLVPYQIKTVEGVQFLLSDALSVIAQDQNGEKRKLWAALQALFLK